MGMNVKNEGKKTSRIYAFQPTVSNHSGKSYSIIGEEEKNSECIREEGLDKLMIREIYGVR